MINLFLQNPVEFLIIAVLLVIAISVHEFSHAFTADRLGDPTARIAGRLTLNPTAHLDPLGTILLFIAGFGWGRPVPFDPFNLKDPKRDSALISIAGPFSNLLMAITGSIILRILAGFPILAISSFLTDVISTLIYFNVVLGVFNLIPVHPLDGFKVIGGLMPEKYYRDWMALEPYGIIFLILLIFPFFGSSPLNAFLSPIVSSIMSILVPTRIGGII